MGFALSRFTMSLFCHSSDGLGASEHPGAVEPLPLSGFSLLTYRRKCCIMKIDNTFCLSLGLVRRLLGRVGVFLILLVSAPFPFRAHSHNTVVLIRI